MIDRFRGEYAFLSNFYPSPIKDWQGFIYQTVEHAYQSAKTLDPVWNKRIREAPTPGNAKRLGRLCPVAPNFIPHRIACMRYYLTLKFQIPTLRQQLDSTGNEILIEGNTWNDRFWGECKGKGKNNLGILLMAIREENRNVCT